MKREDFNNILKNMALLSQLGLSIVMPMLICIALCWYLNAQKGVGMWIYFVGFFFGIGASFMTAYKFYLSEIQKEKKENKKKKKRVSFNKHT